MPSFRPCTFYLLVATFCLLLGCKNKTPKEVPVTAPAETLFSLLPSEKTNITFSNTLTETEYGNVLTYQYFYNGGGVAVSDINNDGLQDIYFSGNMTPNRLYLNKGNMVFQDVTLAAGVAGKANAWKTGVTMADVNGDGLQDIYVCYSGNLPEESRVNQLFINQGVGANGTPTFLDQAREYGLADSAFSTQASFFDYDRDNDLDMFLLNHNPALFRNLDEVAFKNILQKPEPMMRVKLFRNDKGRYTDVSDKAGLHASALTYGLGAGIADINNDGWPDIYVSNDYSAPDYLYINNGNGTFSNKLPSAIGHTPIYSMGNDIADINNDALPDIYTLDMLPEDNRRQKLLFSPDNYEHFDLFLRVGFHYQYMRNMLQVNNGNGTFSEIGQLGGLSNTDWSWAPLFADYDNDGWKDLFVTNGFLRDFTNLDFIKYRSSFMQSINGQVGPRDIKALLDKIPASNVSNYIFRNNGNLTFENKGAAWGVDVASNSNGAAYADLDNDGDLDLISNNLNQPAFIYQNQSRQQLQHHYLQIKLAGSGQNTAGIGAKVFLYAQGQRQYLEQMPTRGFQSSVSPVLHFGLGPHATIDSLGIVWPDQKQQVLRQLKADQVLTLEQKEATGKYQPRNTTAPHLTEIKSPLAFAHQSEMVNDFKRQPLLVNPLSFSGPCLVKADVNHDGLEDVYAGGGKGQAGSLYLQQKGGTFALKVNPAFAADKQSEDTDALFFDANNDQQLDLYVTSGGYSTYLPDDALLQDRLYLGDGKGNFTKSINSLPVMRTSSSCVRAADVNQDGLPDLFVGGRVIPGRYPETPPSYLLLNTGGGRFQDKTATLAPALQQLGLVTDAVWQDLNNDKTAELIVVGDWMPVTIFRNTNGTLVNETKSYFKQEQRGWWNKLLVGDFNQDGRPDLIIGNLGLNSQCKASDKQPAELYYKDFDDNGSVDPILCFYMQGRSYPYVTRDELLDQISIMRTRFPDYKSYADATLQDIFTPEELKGAARLYANNLKTSFFVQGADGKFTQKSLPLEVQFSPVYALSTLDYDQDGKQDLLLGGNLNQARLRFGNYDANYGVLLRGDGRGQFTYVPQTQSGLNLKGDVRSLLPVNNTLFVGMNQKPVKAYKVIKR